jgi:hypothetical protein
MVIFMSLMAMAPIILFNITAKGEYIRRFGGHNNKNPEHNLTNAHGVAIDNRDSKNHC